jgi:small conductance mechanosensitive channel
MREFLEKTIPFGALHTWVVEGVETALKLLLAVLLFAVARWLAVKAVGVVMLPLKARAHHEDESGTMRLRTLEGLAKSSITYVLLFLVTVTFLGQVGINVAALITGAGVAGLAVSFGAQRLVRDVLTGFFLLIEDQFRIGEVVTLLSEAGLPPLNGTVLDMGLRITRLQELSGKMVTVANGDIAAVINHSRGPITATVEVAVAPDAPLDRIRDLAASMTLPEELFTGAARVEGVTALQGEKMTLRIAAPAQPGKAPEAELALRQSLGAALREAEIEVR